MDLVQDLDEVELKELIASVKRMGHGYERMSDAATLVELLSYRVPYQYLLPHCRARKIVLWMVKQNMRLLEFVPEDLRASIEDEINRHDDHDSR